MMNKKQILGIHRKPWSAMLDYCTAQMPLEACGFLFGAHERETTLFVPVANIHNEPKRHFLMEPQGMIQALFAGHLRHLKPVGIVHSHPRTPPVPSAEDMRSPWRGSAFHWIVSLADPQIPEVKVYKYVRQGERWICISYPFEIF